MFAYPFRTSVLGWLVGLSLVAVVLQALTGVIKMQWLPHFRLSFSPDALAFAVIGIVLELFWWLLAFKLAVEALRAAASGREDKPGRENWVDDAQAMRQLALWGGLLLAGYLILIFLGLFALIFFCALLAALLPAILVLLGMEDSLRRAFEWRALRELVHRAGLDYLAVAAKLTGLALLVAAAGAWVFAAQPRWLGVPLSRFAVLYALVAGYHELGRVMERHRRKLGLAEQEVTARPLTGAGSLDEELSMRAAERYAAEGRLPKAAQQLEPLLRDPGASTGVHARYRELLTAIGDVKGLLQHARAYVPILLALGKEDEALALYLDSAAFDRWFELEDAAKLGHLIAVATRKQQPELAVSLAEGYLRRFPDEPEAVPNGLGAARLMDRLGREEDARRLLVDLVRRFPAHPLRGELVAALETLEESARRGRR